MCRRRKMKNRFWEFIKKPQNMFALFVFLIILGLVFLQIISVFEFGSEKLVYVIITVLGIIGLLLLALHYALHEFQNQFQLEQSLIQSKLDQLEHPNLCKVLQTFGDLEEDIKSDITAADEIWLLSRTGRGWWTKFYDQFTNGPNEKKMCFLFLDPNGAALQMVVNSDLEPWEENYDPNNLEAEKEKSKRLLYNLRTNYRSIIDLRVIDHLPAWSLLIINPNNRSKESKIYVELAPYHAGVSDRPILKVGFDDTELFNLFMKDEFEKMWERATPWVL